LEDKMTAVQILVVMLLIAAIALAAFVLWRRAQTRQLQRQFGPEYDRALERHRSRADAERELRDRERRHDELDIRPLDPAVREQSRRRWTLIQEQFVDNPRPAVEQADKLVTSVIAERGYPVQSFDEQTASLSVEHARTLDHYRRGHDIGTRAATGADVSTEELRQAMVHYRALLDDLLDLPHGERAATTPAEPARPRKSGPSTSDPAAGPAATESPTRGETEWVPADRPAAVPHTVGRPATRGRARPVTPSSSQRGTRRR
jgi:hypothetical protein